MDREPQAVDGPDFKADHAAWERRVARFEDDEPMTHPDTVLKWAMVYGVIEVDEFDSVEDAVLTAERLSDAGAEALICIEVLGPDMHYPGDGVRIIDRDEVWRLAAALRPPTPPPLPGPRYTHYVDVWTPPDDRFDRRKVRVGWHHNAADAERHARKLHLLGDRVVISTATPT